MDINCTYKFANESTNITVGDVFEAQCQLPPEKAAHAPIDVSKLAVKQADPTKKSYDLVVVKAAAGGDHIGLALTSYIVGPKELSGVVITDGTEEYILQPPIIFEVQSVIKQDPNQKPEMFGPMSIGIVIPLFYWVVLASVLLVSVLSSVFAYIRHRKRKKLLQRLESLEDGTQPVQQFFTSYRRFQRENLIFSSRSQTLDGPAEEATQSSDDLLKLVKAVETGLRIYLARRFRITSFEFGWKAILNELDKYHEFFYSILGIELAELSREFLKAGIGKNKLSPKDALLISEKSRRWIEKADQLQIAIIAKDNQAIKKLRGSK